jgi:N-acetylmuramoyl-L-alanine amidase
MTTLVIENRLLFGRNPDARTEARRSFAALAPEEPPEGIGGMHGPRDYVAPLPLAPEGDHFARPRPEPDHHHHRPHAREMGHHHRPHEREPNLAPAAPSPAAHGAPPQNFIKENADAVRATAKRLGISPQDLSTIIGYETAGSYSPSKRGLGGHTGLIQFGREEQRKYGVHPGQTFAEQMPAVEQYLKDRGVKPGMGLRDVYSTVLAGSPGRYSARDIGGSVDEHVARMQRERASQAEAFLASGGDHTSQKRLLGMGPSAPSGQITAVGGAPASAFIAHHTGGGGTVEDVQRTLRARNLGVQYIMDREGNIYRTGGAGEHQIRHGSGVGAGLSNANTVGMEIIARHDADVLPIQRRRFVEFIHKNYPNTPVYGHGEVNPDHKEAAEGRSVTEAVRADRAARTARATP